MNEHHLLLETGDASGKREPVHVEALGGTRYRILHSPGLVYGIASGDEIEALEVEGFFRVVKRGGNLAVRVLAEEPLGALAESLGEEVSRTLGGTLDGRIARGAAFSVPVGVGFPKVEALFSAFVAAHPGTLWEYGNVYDSNDRPLNWWSRSDT